MTDKDVTKKEEIVGAEEEAAAVKEPKETLTGMVNVKLLNVRKEPSKESAVVKLLNFHDKIDILDNESKDFYKTTDGYVMKQFIDII